MARDLEDILAESAAEPVAPVDVRRVQQLVRRRRRRRYATSAVASIVTVGTAAVLIAGPLTAPQPTIDAPTTGQPASSLSSGAETVSESLPAPTTSSPAASASAPLQEFSLSEAAGRAAIITDIRTASPPDWKLELLDSIPLRSDWGWEGWHLTGTADDGQGKSQISVSVRVGSQKHLNDEAAKASSSQPALQPGTCPPQLAARVTCTATPQPDGRVLLVMTDASSAAETGQVGYSVALFDVNADVMISADSQNYAIPENKDKAPDLANTTRATRSTPIYSTELLTKLVLDLARHLQPYLSGVPASS